MAEAKLATLGLRTLGDVAATPVEVLRTVFGAWAESVRDGALGLGSADISKDRPAFKEHDVEGDTAGSLSNERTFRRDTGDPAIIESRLASLCERVCWRARQRGVEARTVTLKLRYADFETISRSRTIAPTSSEFELFPVVRDLCAAARARRELRSACSASRSRTWAGSTGSSSCSATAAATRRSTPSARSSAMTLSASRPGGGAERAGRSAG